MEKNNYFNPIRKLFLVFLLFFVLAFANAQNLKINGTVKDATGAPIVGATVAQLDTNYGVVTNVKGGFSMSLQPNGKKEIEITYIGYQSQKIELGSRTVISVVLQENRVGIDEVTVVAYGVQKKETLTGAISSISTDALLKAPTTSIANALAGQLSGVSTIQNSGQPGAEDPDIFVRGMGSLNETASKPLMLVDGVEMPFFQMDPNEIESITVLKDASATAVFGVRGANGVILVSTRRGDTGAPKISLSSTVGINVPTRVLGMANSYDFARHYNEMQINDGAKLSGLAFSPYAIEMFRTNADPIMYPNTDWREFLFEDYSMQTQNNINISGGIKNVRYFTSVGYMYQNGLMKEFGGLDYDSNFSYQRYNYRANLDIDVTKTTLLKLNIGGILGVQKAPNAHDNGIWAVINTAHPYAGAGFVDGHPLQNDGVFFGDLPSTSAIAGIYGKGFSTDRKNTMNINLEVEQKLDVITKGLKVQVKGAYNTEYSYKKNRTSQVEIWTPYYKGFLDSSNENDKLPDFDKENYDKTIMYRVAGMDSPLGYGESNSKARNWYMEGSLRYNRKFGSHNIGALLLYNQSKKYYPKTFTECPSAYVGLVGRLTYDYKSKYLAEFNAGYNGSENFPPELRYGFFPAGSVGWIISEENFMKTQQVINFLKVRASVGLVGNDNMTVNGVQYRYLYLPDAYYVNQGGYNFGDNIDQNQKGAREGKLGNPYITWETSLKQNYGLDLALLNNKLRVTLDYFREYRKDILINRGTVPGIYALGASLLPVVNMGEVSNHGFEVDINWNHPINNNFRYWVNANVSYSKNKIISKDEVPQNEPYMQETGRSVGLYKGYIVDRFYSEEDFNEAGKLKEGIPVPNVSIAPGDLKYKDLNGDGLIDSDDETYQGYSRRPQYVVGLNYGVNYKGFEFSMNWTANLNRTLLMESSFRSPFGSTGRSALMTYFIDERWTPERGQSAKTPRFSRNSITNNNYNSSLWFRDGSFLRLKNIRLGYTFTNSRHLKAVGISNLGLFITGYNLLTIDSFKIMDPEADPSKSATYPITQTYNFGVNITF